MGINLFLTVNGLTPIAQPPSWRTTPCRLFAAAYSIYSQLPYTAEGRSSIRNPRTRNAVGTRTHQSWTRLDIFCKIDEGYFRECPPSKPSRHRRPPQDAEWRHTSLWHIQRMFPHNPTDKRQAEF
jgi:hypothetical protein